jgi:hypothetical protein
LIDLPQTLAKLAAGTNERFDGLDKCIGEFEAGTNERFDGLDKRIDGVDQHLDGIDNRLDRFETATNERFVVVGKRFDKVNQRFDRVEGSVNALRDDIAPLKGAHVRNAAVREAGLIAGDMGFTLVRTLSPEQIGTLIESQATTDIPDSDLRSFRRADLIMEVTDGDDVTCYVAVEISFTANGRDTTRAVRNAEFLTRFTGKRSRPAIAGLRRDDRIEESIESGEVFWYQLDRSDLESE